MLITHFKTKLSYKIHMQTEIIFLSLSFIIGRFTQIFKLTECAERKFSILRTCKTEATNICVVSS